LAGIEEFWLRVPEDLQRLRVVLFVDEGSFYDSFQTPVEAKCIICSYRLMHNSYLPSVRAAMVNLI